MQKKTASFDTELFKRSVLYNVKTLYRKTLEEATDQQIFQAVSYAIKDAIVDKWLTSQKEYDKQDPKMVYYLSMEFLMGRALGNNLINLQAYDVFRKALQELGIDLNVVEIRNRTLLWETAVWEDWRHVFLILWQRSAMRHTAAESVTATECLNRRSETVIRWRYRITGCRTVIRSSCADRNMPRK